MRLAAGILVIFAVGLALWSAPERAGAEWYVAGQVGPTFGDRLKDIQGTGSLTTLTPQISDFDLANSIAYGAKLGYFPGGGWLGLEVEAFNTTPNIKSFEGSAGYVPGVHFRVTTIGLNLIARYPGRTYQPYIGIGGEQLSAI